MPLPLLLAPAAVATAKAAASEMALSFLGGTAVGGGVVGAIWYYFSGGEPQLLDDIMESLDRQHTLINNRIARANNTLDLVCRNVTNLKAEIDAAIEASSLSSAQLQDATNHLANTTTRLQRTIRVVAQCSAELQHSLVEAREIVDDVAAQQLTSDQKLADFDALLSAKEEELIQTTSDISSLNNTVQAQARTILQLTTVIERLEASNQSQEQVIQEKQQAIDDIKLKTMRLVDQLRFFRQAPGREAAPPIPVPNTGLVV